MPAAIVRSVATRRFWELFHGLPPEIRNLAVKNYHLWQRDPRHPLLRFRRLQGSKDRFSIRVGDHYRAIGAQTGEKIIWVGSAPTRITTGWSALEVKSDSVFRPSTGSFVGSNRVTRSTSFGFYGLGWKVATISVIVFKPTLFLPAGIAAMLAACGRPSSESDSRVARSDLPTLDRRPMAGGLKPPVAKLKTPGIQVKDLDTRKGKIRIGQKMIDLFEILPDPAVEDSEDDDYVLVTDAGTFTGSKYVYRYVLPDGRRIVVRYSRRLPSRPYRIISDNQPGAGERQNKLFPYLVEDIVLE